MSNKRWKSCPFCGSEEVAEECVLIEGQDLLQPMCSSCWSTAPTEYWNKRVTADMSTVRDLVFIVDALDEWIMAVPEDVVSRLPGMPGIDRDWADGVLSAVRKMIKSKKEANSSSCQGEMK